MEPKVSVIIPIYNVEKYVEECVESVLEQTLEEIEVICMDDASTDNSYEVVRQCINNDSRFQLYRLEQNHGLSYVRNLGMSKATGKYIYFLDSDDYLEKTALEKLYIYAENKQAQGIFFGAHVEYEDDITANEKIEYRDSGNVLTGTEFFVKKNQSGEYQSAVCFQFWRLKYIKEKKLQFYEGIFFEDTLFTICAILKSKSVMCISDVLYHYRKRATSITQKQEKEYIYSYMIVYYELWKIWITSGHVNEIAEGVQKRLDVFHKRISMAIGQFGYVPKIRFEDKACQYLYEKITKITPANQYVKELEDTLILDLQKKDHIFVYGAGVIADEVIRMLEEKKIRIEGIVITKRNQRQDQYKSYPILVLEEVEMYKGSKSIILGLSKKFHEEIKLRIENFGYEWIDILI